MGSVVTCWGSPPPSLVARAEAEAEISSLQGQRLVNKDTAGRHVTLETSQLHLALRGRKVPCLRSGTWASSPWWRCWDSGLEA